MSHSTNLTLATDSLIMMASELIDCKLVSKDEDQKVKQLKKMKNKEENFDHLAMYSRGRLARYSILLNDGIQNIQR